MPVRAFPPIARPIAVIERFQLASVRAGGIAYDREEHTIGISAVGATVSGATGEPAAVSVPVPAQRFYGNEPKLTSSLRAACTALSTALGAPSAAS